MLEMVTCIYLYVLVIECLQYLQQRIYQFVYDFVVQNSLLVILLVHLAFVIDFDRRNNDYVLYTVVMP